MLRVKKIVGLIILLLFFLYAANGQSTNVKFDKLDSIARKKDAPTLDSLMTLLVKPYTTDMGKVRAIFIWITEHISYDVEGYHNNNYYTLSYDDSPEDSTKVYEAHDVEVANRVFKSRKAVCDGYSRLFKVMCDMCNINCVVIEGHARTVYDMVGLMEWETGHAWNAVQIDDKWYLLDATWASGYADLNVTKFYKKFDDFYFLPSPQKLIYSHLPAEDKWQLLPSPVSSIDFFRQPIITSAYYTNNIISIKPTDGIIELKKTDSNVTIELIVRDTTAVADMEILEYKSGKKYSTSYNMGVVVYDSITHSATVANRVFAKSLPLDKTTYKLDLIYNMQTIVVYAVWHKD